MALSARSKNILKVGLADRRAGAEVAAALDSVLPGSAAANVPAIGALATVHAALGAPAAVGTGAVDVACALAADVDARLTAIHTAFDAQITTLNARIATLQAKTDALLAAMVAADQMLP